MSHNIIPHKAVPATPAEAFDIRKLIIEKPEKQQPTQKFLLGGLTLLFWGAYSFLWTPLINTLGWAFGFYAFYEHLVMLRGWQGPALAKFAVTGSLTLLACVLVSSLVMLVPGIRRVV